MSLPHTLGPKSKERYDTLHPDLQEIIGFGLEQCRVDFSIVEGHRPVEKQFELYKKGREFKQGRWLVANKKQVVTNIDGHRKKGNHNYQPSMAVDIAAYVPGKKQLTWDIEHLAYIAATLMSIADALYQEGIITHRLRWGGNWDGDGDLSDNNLFDRPHLELYKP